MPSAYACLRPNSFGDWFYHRIVDWSQDQPNGSACVHVFRKTGLPGAVDGEAENQKVAEDACVNLRVMATHYTTEQERQSTRLRGENGKHCRFECGMD